MPGTRGLLPPGSDPTRAAPARGTLRLRQAGGPERERLGASRDRSPGPRSDVVFVIPTSESAFQEGLLAARPPDGSCSTLPSSRQGMALLPHEAYQRDLSVSSATPVALRDAAGSRADHGRRGPRRASGDSRVPLSAAREGFRLAAQGGRSSRSSSRYDGRGKTPKVRLDRLLSERGLAPSRPGPKRSSWRVGFASRGRNAEAGNAGISGSLSRCPSPCSRGSRAEE